MTSGSNSSNWSLSPADKSVLGFFALAYAIAWSVLGLFALWARDLPDLDAVGLMGIAETWSFSQLDVELPAPRWLLYGLTRIADFSFTLAGLVFIGIIEGRAGFVRIGRALVQWRIGLRWYLLAALPLIFYAIATAISVSGNGGGEVAISAQNIAASLIGMEAGLLVYFFTRGPLGEEIGLRGFALHRLQQHRSPAMASLIIGLLWAGWHVPVLVGRNPVEIGIYIVLVTLLSFIFTYLYNGSGGSLIPCLLFHTFQNAEEVFETFWPGLVGSDWEMPSSLLLLAAGLVLTVLVVVQSRKEKIDDSPISA